MNAIGLTRRRWLLPLLQLYLTLTLCFSQALLHDVARLFELGPQKSGNDFAQ
jgi:hypothetical protein